MSWVFLVVVAVYVGWLRIKIRWLRMDLDHQSNELGRFQNQVFGFVTRVNAELEELRGRR